MKKTYGLITFLSFVLILFSGCGGAESTDTKSIKIGVILPLTGNFAVIGEGEKKGIDLAIEELKVKFPGQKIEVVYEDFASDTKKAATAANKLISIDKVDALITSTTGACEAVSPIVEQSQKIHFVISPDIDIVSRSKYNFRVYYNLKTEADVVNQFISKVKPSSAAFLASRYSSLQRLVDDRLAPDFTKNGVTVLSKEYVELTEKDFKNVIVKLKAENPDLLFLAPMTNQVDLFTNQLNDYGIKPSSTNTIIGSFTFNWKPAEFIATLEGYYIATPIFQTYGESNAFSKQFTDKYAAKPTFDVAYAYDNALILTELLMASGKRVDSFTEAFNRLGERNGASGRIRFSGANDTDPEIAIMKVVNGKLVAQ